MSVLGNRSGLGAIIALEGLSSVGKSRAVELLGSALRERGQPVRVVAWNSVHVIRRLCSWLDRFRLLGPTSYSFLSWLGCLICYAREMAPALRRGEVVIADRYVHTGLTRDAVNGAPRLMSCTLARLLPEPDLVLFFAVMPEVACRGIARRGDKALFHCCKTIPRELRGRERDLYYMSELYRAYLAAFATSECLREDALVVLGSESETVNSRRATTLLPVGLLSQMNSDVRLYVAALAHELSESSTVLGGRWRTTIESSAVWNSRAPNSELQHLGKGTEMYDKIGSVLQRYTQAAPPTLEACTKLRDLGITSVNVVNIIADLEEEFGITLDMGSLSRESFESVETIAALVNAAGGTISAAV